MLILIFNCLIYYNFTVTAENTFFKELSKRTVYINVNFKHQGCSERAQEKL